MVEHSGFTVDTGAFESAVGAPGRSEPALAEAYGAGMPAQEFKVICDDMVMVAPFAQRYSTMWSGSVVELTGRSKSGTVVVGSGGR